ncbi:MAG TPA: hypothetical protein PLL96_10350 [Syntrophorhabdaceae bacterium]|nr:hypothetical protein [Syntrophorhabdaceae bacterium]HPC67670.1 hypothetical protein [Syntrophorhabdaceae bacterium]HQE81063.1 hypothetical protein [Syntrophorhabdaceae bacterium]HQK47449.1 hypothetical protein [Syntrophorhabdaceae bacterium]
MKKVFYLLLIGLFLVLPLIAQAQFGFGGKKGGEEAKVDVEGLSKRSAKLLDNVRSATISFAQALVPIAQAVGHKEMAEKLEQSIKNAKDDKSQDSVKNLVGVTNDATNSLNKIDLNSALNKEKAKEFLNESLLHMGAGVIMDGIAAKNASDLLKEAQDALKKASITQAGKVKEVISVSQFVVKEIPPQASSVKNFSDNLIKYATTNGIPTPSKEDIEKKAKDMAEG